MKQRFLISFLTLTLLVIAYLLGTKAGGWISSRKRSEHSKQLELKKQFVLEKMENIKVGSKLPNHYFHNLEGKYIELNKLIKSKCMLTYITAECESCIEQIEAIRNALNSDLSKMNSVLLSFSSPFELIDPKENHDLQLEMLYDHGNQYGRYLNILSYPTNILVDSDLTIIGIYPERLSENDLKEVMK